MAGSFRLERKFLGLQLLAVALAVLMLAVMVSPIVWFAVQLGGTSGPIPSENARNCVAYTLMEWQLTGPMPGDYAQRLERIESTIQVVQTFSESDGFHGDGADWIEFELPETAMTEIRDRLGAQRPNQFDVRAGGTSPEHSDPVWWPRHWPAETVCYSRSGAFKYLVLTPTGNRAWFKGIRT